MARYFGVSLSRRRDLKRRLTLLTYAQPVSLPGLREGVLHLRCMQCVYVFIHVCVYARVVRNSLDNT